METSASSSSSSNPPPAVTQSLLEALTGRGWCFKGVDQVKALIAAQFSSRGKSCTIDSVESELVNLDLRSIGGRSLPEPSHLRHASHLKGPKVLQVNYDDHRQQTNIDFFPLLFTCLFVFFLFFKHFVSNADIFC